MRKRRAHHAQSWQYFDLVPIEPDAESEFQEYTVLHDAPAMFLRAGDTHTLAQEQVTVYLLNDPYELDRIDAVYHDRS